ncbi:uncharacterized protein LOC119766292 [Culex quinquefasciatus]|uniref:uncharacterized protein LOC119766292 n=1 Tax=Culex quinquefasciatus TaxID=7176 RepID=UPI0018E3EB11|nr:uncharacterized protein LOC119766292 [Culex quinquefasciatus]
MNGSSQMSSQHDDSAMNEELFRQQHLEIRRSAITASQGSINWCFIHATSVAVTREQEFPVGDLDIQDPFVFLCSLREHRLVSPRPYDIRPGEPSVRAVSVSLDSAQPPGRYRYTREP